MDRAQFRSVVARRSTIVGSLLGWLLLVPTLLAEVPSGEVGVPRRASLPLPADELGGSRQVWSIAQGHDGLLYFGTSSGVLEFDGESWALHPMSNRTTVRSMAVGDDGRLWLGGQGDVGWLETLSNGERRVRSLLSEGDAELLPQAHQFADVWKTHWTAGGVLFQSFEQLLLWDGVSFGVWRAEQGFHFSYPVADGVVVIERGRGLVRWSPELEPGSPLPLVPGGGALADHRVYAVLPRGDGSWLVATRDAGFYRLDDSGIGALGSGADPFFTQAQIYHGSVLADGTLALATLRSGVVLVDSNGGPWRHLDRASGLASDGVKFLMPGAAGGLWLGLDRGVDRLDLPSPWSSFGEAEGLDGVALDLVRHRGSLFAATNRGLLRLVPSRSGAMRTEGRPRWVGVAGLEQQTWALLDLGDRLLIGGTNGVYELVGERVRRVADVRAANLRRSRRGDRVWLARFDGLSALRRTADDWQLEEPWPDLRADVRTVEEDDQGRLWMWSKGQGLLVLAAPSAEGGDPLPITLADGGSASEVSWVEQTADGPRFVSPRGVYRAEEDREHLVPLAISGWPGEQTGLELAWIESAGDGGLWLGSGARLARLEEEGSGWRYVESALPGRERDFVSVLLAEDDGVVWIGGSESLMRYDSHRSQAVSEPPATLLRTVTAHRDGDPVPRAGACVGTTPWSLPARANSLRFEFTAPTLATQRSEFQTRVVGLESGWSPWRDETGRELTLLSAGRYRFEVRARDARGRIGPATQCAFEIVPPWHQRWWVLMLFTLAGAGLISWGFAGLLRRARIQSRRATEDARRQEELDAARRLQQQLLPGELPVLDHLEIAAHQETATEVGGDYYDFFPQDDGRLYIALGDATGHGLGAGLLVTATKAALLSLREGSMRQAAEEVNTVLNQMGFDRRLNMVLGLMSLSAPGSSGELELSASGGGLAPIYHLAAEGGVEEIILGGLPLGAVQAIEPPEIHRRLEVHDVVVLMSDGLPELANGDGELLGYERLHEILVEVANAYRDGGCEESAADLMADVLQRTHDWAGELVEPEDDLTLMVLRVRDAQRPPISR